MKINDLETLRLKIELLEDKSKLEKERVVIEFKYLKIQLVEEVLKSIKNLF